MKHILLYFQSKDRKIKSIGLEYGFCYILVNKDVSSKIKLTWIPQLVKTYTLA